MEKLKKLKSLVTKIGKRNLIILSVMLMIGLAVYLNYLWFYAPSADQGYGDNNITDVGGNENNGEGNVDYFAAAALSRENARNESIEVLQSVVDSSEGEERETALAQISQIAIDMENEANIETLVKAKGYAQCIAVINGDTASIIVSSENALDPAQVAAISAIVYEQSGIVPENLTIAQK